MEQHTVLILENIRSAYNVGSLFRTADAAGVEKIYLFGITPAPLDRFTRPRRDIAKAALGAEQVVPWEACSNLTATLERYRRLGYSVVALEQAAGSRSYTNLAGCKKLVLIIGSETDGVSEECLVGADWIAEIPMYGKKESLNVAVAGGIALFAATRQR